MITYAIAQNTVDTVVSNFKQDGILNEQEVALVNKAVKTDVQVRDYLMGLAGIELAPEEAVSLLRVIMALGDNANLHAVCALFEYEAGNTGDALAHVAQALDLDGENGLAPLAGRVIKAGWDRSAFAEMRNQLHPKVVEHLATMPDTEIGGE